MRFKKSLRVAKPPPKPLLIYDGECNFCKYWAARWRKSAEGRVDFTPLQDRQLEIQFPEVPQSELERAIHFIDDDGAVYLGAEAVFRSRAKSPKSQLLLRLYQRSRVFAKISELVYHFVSQHRSFFSWIWGTHP